MKREDDYLECEKWWVFALMMVTAGYFGAFTYSIRGGAFCNAQTANFVLFAMALGNAEWKKASYYIIPMTAYLLGAYVSESAALRIKKLNFIRWDTLLIAIEMVVVAFIGFLPESAPYQITQVLINLICSMQYNTFRQAEGVPMATTFCTNHLRQVGVALCKAVRHPGENEAYLRKSRIHICMLIVFVMGGVVSTYLCRIFLGKAIWGALLPLGIVFLDLLYADTRTEHDKLDRVPHGH